MPLDQIFALEMWDAGLPIGVGDGGIDQMPDAGSLCRIGGNNALAGFLFHPCLVAVAHQEHGVDALCGIDNRSRVGEIAGNNVRARRCQWPGGIAVGPACQRFHAVASRKKGARDGAALLARRAGDENGSFAGHPSAPSVAWSKVRDC